MSVRAHSQSKALPVLAPVFGRDRNCQACDLHQAASSFSVCIPSRSFSLTPKVTKPVALFIVGEAPGGREDAEGQCFVGPAGDYLSDLYIKGMGLNELADVYLGNSVRCRPPQNRTPNKGHLKSCRPYLLADLEALSKCYKRIVVLCVGSTSTQAILNLKLGEALKVQGQEVSPVLGSTTLGPFPVFSTYHPAYLMPGRNPSAIVSVEDHLRLLDNHLEGTPASGGSPDLPAYVVAPPVVRGIRFLSLDIETYGAVATCPDQRFFHPRKSELLDKVSRSRMIQTVAIAWADGDDYHVGAFVWGNPKHREMLRGWLRELSRNEGTLLGMNMAFDVSYLRYCDPAIRQFLKPFGPVKLWDISVDSYLHSELRPERSLKSLAPLFGITKYSEDETVRGHRYQKATDHGLLAYNAKDAVATLMIHEHLRGRIAKDFGEFSLKLGAYCESWYSDLIWSVILMGEGGVHLNTSKLEALLARHTRRMAWISDAITKKYEQPLSGKGSQTFLQEVVNEVARRVPARVSKDLEVTPTKRQISITQSNLTALSQNCAHDDKFYPVLRLLLRFRSSQKLVSSYLRPLLVGRGKNSDDLSSVLLGGLVYPSWYIVPSSAKGSDDSEGGTNQCRIICKRPALQTAPRPVKSAYCSRFPGGTWLSADLSQIELRIAALLSNDARMVEEYSKDKCDKHTDTTLMIFGSEVLGRSDFPLLRQVGKAINFATLYGATAYRLRMTLKEEVGLDWSVAECQTLIDRFRKAYPGLIGWQQQLVDSVKETGILSLPLIGQSRYFLGSVDETWVNEIYSMGVQPVAANVMISAQVAIQKEMLGRRLKSILCLNVYDAVGIDCSPGEEKVVLGLIAKHLPNPPYYRDLCSELGRSIRITYDVVSKRRAA